MENRQYLVITNNPAAAAQCEQFGRLGIQCRLVRTDIRSIAFLARDCLLNGFCLTADPLAGRRERPVPFLTVIMEKCGTENFNLAYEVIRVEHFVKVYCEFQPFLDSLSPEELKDYGIIDESLTKSCLSLMAAGK